MTRVPDRIPPGPIKLTYEDYVELLPAVEILSPWSVRRDRVTKAALYARLGIGHYWVLDPEARAVEVYEAGGAEYRPVATVGAAGVVRTSLFPGLELDAHLVWE